MTAPHLVEELSALVERAERAVLTLEGSGIEGSTNEIDAWSQRLRQEKVTASELGEVRALLNHYQGVCQLAAETLHEALMAACEPHGTGSSRYGGSGRLDDASPQALVERYG